MVKLLESSYHFNGHRFYNNLDLPNLFDYNYVSQRSIDVRGDFMIMVGPGFVARSYRQVE